MARTDPQRCAEAQGDARGACACARTRFRKSAPRASTTSSSCPRTCRGSSSTPTARPARSAEVWASASISHSLLRRGSSTLASEELKVAVDRGVVAVGAAYLGAIPPRSQRPVVATLRAGTRRPESRRGRGGVPGRRALAPDADRPRACRAAPRRFSSPHAVIWRRRSSTRSSAASNAGARRQTGALGGEWPELRAAPDLALVRDYHRDPATPEEGGNDRHRLVRWRALGHRRRPSSSASG